jgi:hypothetical protein
VPAGNLQNEVTLGGEFPHKVLAGSRRRRCRKAGFTIGSLSIWDDAMLVVFSTHSVTELELLGLLLLQILKKESS